MRFVCDSCRAQYMISDEKVGPKGVKVRCKKCGFVILVQKPEPATVGELAETQVMTTQIADAAAADAAAQNAAAAISGSASTETSGLFSGVGEDEIGAVFDQVLSGAPAPAPSGPPPDDEEFATTRVVDATTLKKLALAGEDPAPPKLEETPPAPQHDWYVAIEEQQQGPFNLEKIRDLWERGEIGADNLCWRPGFSDWLPLSEVSELAVVLAPRKPVISASAESVASNPVVDTKESSAPDSSDGTGEWQPSAASALASLVNDEINALAQTKAKPPEPAPEPSSPGLIPGLIDAPPPPQEDVAEAMTVIRRPAHEPPADERTRTASRPPLLEPVAPAAAPAAPFVPPPYAYSAPVAQHGLSKRMIAIIAGVGGFALVLLLLVVYLLGRTERPVEVAVRPPPPPVHQQVTTTPTPPPANPTQPAVAQNPTPTTTPAVAHNPATTQPTQQAAQTTPKTVPAKTEPVKTEVAQQTPDETTAHSRRERHHRVSHARSDSQPDEVAQAEPPPKPKHSESNADSAFDAIFGGGGSDSSSSTPPPSNGHHHRDVYVPPAPGEDDVPDSLQQSDIMQVVLANKPSIVKCVLEQKRKDPNLSGQLMMRWSIQPSGRTSGISVQTSEFKHTYMANCISGLIRGWRFPRHRQQGAPIDFPFTF